ncbi:MAG: glutamine amidotransferase [Rhodanobacteraceae bacterium]
MLPLLLIQTGEAPEPIHARFGGFAEWFRVAMGLAPEHLHVVRVDQGGILPAPDTIAGAVITGSGAMVTDREPWSENTAAWLRNAMDAELPLFGVCYGHQLMAHALGGEVGWLPAQREIGTQPVSLTHAIDHDDPLCGALPEQFPAHTTHRQSVLTPPRGARVLARSDLDPHQILHYGSRAISAQFHPEFTAAMMRAYLDAREDILQGEDFDVDALLRGVRETPAAMALLQRFAHMALDGSQLAA